MSGEPRISQRPFENTRGGGAADSFSSYSTSFNTLLIWYNVAGSEFDVSQSDLFDLVRFGDMLQFVLLQILSAAATEVAVRVAAMKVFLATLNAAKVSLLV